MNVGVMLILMWMTPNEDSSVGCDGVLVLKHVQVTVVKVDALVKVIENIENHLEL
jgi:hypothetical protein|tara:strand:+ start:2412 stop:2576 length:165 start_codon:yes stop_codon:yes gene_type:complete